MEIFEILNEGKRNQMQGLEPVVQLALSESARLEEVVGFSFDATPKIAARAVWVLRQVGEREPTLLMPFKEYIVERLDRDLVWEVRSEFCHVLPKLDFSEEELKMVVAFFEKGLQSDSRIVVAWSLDGWYELSKKYALLIPGFERMLDQALAHQFPAARARARAIQRDFLKRKK